MSDPELRADIRLDLDSEWDVFARWQAAHRSEPKPDPCHRCAGTGVEPDNGCEMLAIVIAFAVWGVACFALGAWLP